MRRRIYKIGRAEQEDRDRVAARSALVSVIKGKPETTGDQRERRRKDKAIAFGHIYGGSATGRVTRDRPAMREITRRATPNYMIQAQNAFKEMAAVLGTMMGQRILTDWASAMQGIVNVNGSPETVPDRGRDERVVLVDTELSTEQFVERVQRNMDMRGQAVIVNVLDDFGMTGMEDRMVLLGGVSETALSKAMTACMLEPEYTTDKATFWRLQDEYEARKLKPSYIRERRRPVPMRKFSR